MKSSHVAILIAVLVALAGVVAWLSWPRTDESANVAEDGSSEAVAGSELSSEIETWQADLYFPGGGGLLFAERHELPVVAEPAERVTRLVSMLLAGPRAENLSAPLPAEIEVRKVYWIDGRTAYLDLESPEGAPPPASGSTREMLTVYSLVNTVLLNVPEIESLVLLWNGRQLRTFAGHVDTMRPLSARPDLIASALE